MCIILQNVYLNLLPNYFSRLFVIRGFPGGSVAIELYKMLYILEINPLSVASLVIFSPVP